ncbi:BufA1 family periplasmic bufferin-type metallophore [Rickettsia endosymbiont of Cardiosporidium cionae]|uniref:BufA1 family periplasmic bufferin-type metallophore n=1 Tax=Rickettsia endosymbiont of Cardiosporidium cionae TaxID=2777155 RepID=UPI001894F137|nr:DUF2282 domain-containing protein [Rickettsia endosymbiont of Cardiosporidium cionae]KAF8818534.1 hypothetical protein IHI24_000250 [Rickettsia endosymbiont of Cardiosporidium cionae]
MKNVSILAAMTAAITLAIGAVEADNSTKNMMEKCRVIDSNGKGLIKAGKGDCKTSKFSCAGHNKAGDPAAWIMVPQGQCNKINMQDFSSVSDKIKDKIVMPK